MPLRRVPDTGKTGSLGPGKSGCAAAGVANRRQASYNISTVTDGSLTVCPERLRLMNQFSETARIYADLVREMRDLIASGLQSEAHVVHRASRTAWETVERARLALSRHEVDHSCDVSPNPPPRRSASSSSPAR